MSDTAEKKRLSMNTVLKNARIFDDDSWDAETAGFPINNNLQILPNHNDDTNNSISTNSHILDESKEGELDESYIPLDPNISIKSEQTSRIKVEKGHFNKINIKSDPTEDELMNIALNIPNIKKEHVDVMNIKIEKTNDDTAVINNLGSNTPIKTELLHDESNPSPFNKELLRKFTLESPLPKDFRSNTTDEVKKAVKRVFEPEQSEPEYSDVSSENGDVEEDSVVSGTSSRISAKTRLGPKIDDKKSERLSVKKRIGSKVENGVPHKKLKKELETNPDVLVRRQKQIDYGKNTLGYDNYLKNVSRHERTSEDPKTPNKHLKYSRRGWDGLIKQWRLLLHKYDPTDT